MKLDASHTYIVASICEGGVHVNPNFTGDD